MKQTDSIRAQIGERLRWAREQSGLSQGQVASIIGMHRPTISQIEAGQRSVKAEEVSQFAELYEVREEWIISGDSVLGGDEDPRIELAARELSKLKVEDLEAVLRTIKILRAPTGDRP